jgi:serine/threonine-protein kinase SRPK3
LEGLYDATHPPPATRIDGFHAEEIQPSALRAPEVILGSGWGTSADIWNLGCLVNRALYYDIYTEIDRFDNQIFEFLTGKWLFVPRSGPSWTPEQYHLAHMPDMVGEDFDLTYFRQAKHFQNYFDDEGQCIDPPHQLIYI